MIMPVVKVLEKIQVCFLPATETLILMMSERCLTKQLQHPISRVYPSTQKGKCTMLRLGFFCN